MHMLMCLLHFESIPGNGQLLLFLWDIVQLYQAGPKTVDNVIHARNFSFNASPSSLLFNLHRFHMKIYLV